MGKRSHLKIKGSILHFKYTSHSQCLQCLNRQIIHLFIIGMNFQSPFWAVVAVNIILTDRQYFPGIQYGACAIKSEEKPGSGYYGINEANVAVLLQALLLRGNNAHIRSPGTGVY
jgi:hypothetical protein